MYARTFKHCIAVALVQVAGVVMAVAHDGPEHDIQELTEAIAATGQTPHLLLQRAIEYRVLGKLAEAVRDLEEASRMDYSGLPVPRELARTQFSLGKTNEAIDTLTKSVAVKGQEPIDQAQLLMLRAQFYHARSDSKKALEDANKAIDLHGQNPEWYLQRSAMHAAANLPKDRLAGLEVGVAKTGAGVLEMERIEALLDDKQFAVALPLIEHELEDTRIKSSWLIRRAKAFFGLGKKESAQADLVNALDELESRLHQPAPDVSLLLDRASIHELMGNKQQAKSSYEQASDAGADAWVKERIKTLKTAIDAEHVSATTNAVKASSPSKP